MIHNDDDPVVMVVDDERDFLFLTKTLLQRSGFRVDTRTRAPSWRELLTVDPAVILMDVVLEGEDGAEVCRAIKHHPRFARLPIILVSGHGEDRLKKEVNYCGADGFLTKPISKVLVLQLAEHYVKRYRRLGGLHGLKPQAPPAAEHTGTAPEESANTGATPPRESIAPRTLHVVRPTSTATELRAQGNDPVHAERTGEEPGS